MVAWVVSGCAGNLPALPSSTTIEIAAPTPARADFAVVPAELADPGVLDRIRHRTRVRRFGSAWIGLTATPIRSSRASDDRDLVMPVIGETRTKLRIVTEDDEARLGVWIERDDTWDAITAPIQLSDRDGRAMPEAGVWVALGAPVERIDQPHDASVTRRAVRVRDEHLRLEGFVPANVISKLWLAAPGDFTPTDLDLSGSRSWSPPDDARTHAKVMVATKIRAAPDAKAPVIATVESPDVIAVIVKNLGAVREIEVVRPHARIRGFVAASELSRSNDPSSGHGSGTGHGFGMSHADRIEVPTGVCLFDAIDGEVAGVQLEPSTRLGHRRTDSASWSLVYVGTAWSIAALYVRDTSDDPRQPRWESCTQPAHR